MRIVLTFIQSKLTPTLLLSLQMHLVSLLRRKDTQPKKNVHVMLLDSFASVGMRVAVFITFKQ